MPHPIIGKPVRDSITGFKGIATARCEYLHGSPRIEITPVQTWSHGAAKPEPFWVEEDRLAQLTAPEPA